MSKKIPTYKMLTFARGIIAGLQPLEALEASDYVTEGWDNKNSKSVFANELLNKPQIADALAEAQKEVYSDAVMTRREAMERLSKVARASMSELVKFTTQPMWDVNGKRHDGLKWVLREPEDMHPDQLAAISEITTLPGGGVKIKLRDPDAAMRQLAKLMSWDDAPKAAVGPDGHAAPAGVALVLDKSDYKRARQEMLDIDDC